MTILLNMCFNGLTTMLGILALYSNEPYDFIIQIKQISFLYFSMDSIVEYWVYHRLEYIPHHVVSLACTAYIQKDHPLFLVLYTFVFAESTSFVSNLRYVLKSTKSLGFVTDMYLFGYYSLCRFFFIPFIIYHLYEYKLLYYGGLYIIAMSYYWGYKWGQSIYKYHIKPSMNVSS